MIVDEAIEQFARAEGALPLSAIQWARDNWREAGPALVALLARYADGSDRSDTATDALLIAIHLFGEMGETTAFGPLCRLLADGDASEVVLGDGITENLHGILIRTFDGDVAALRGFIAHGMANEFACDAGIRAIAYLTRAGRVSDGQMRGFLEHLRDTLPPNDAEVLRSAWVIVVAILGYADWSEDVERLMQLERVPRKVFDFGHFQELLALTSDSPDGMGGFEREGILPFTDTVASLSTWYGFTPQFLIDRARAAVQRKYGGASPDDPGPVVNPFRHVGRNDPCPCGSGRKFKKCCLVA